MKILHLFKKKGFKYYHSEKYNLDNSLLEPYEDNEENFKEKVVFETRNKEGEFINLELLGSTSYFKYFLDGSRYTFKIADMETTDGRFLPIVAGQLATGVCKRNKGKMKKHILNKKNTIVVYHLINKDDFKELKKEINNIKINNVPFELAKYTFTNNQKPENDAIAKIQKMMRDMEINIIIEMVESKVLKPDRMLVIDGSLQFMNKKADDRLFYNVVGISKSFNHNLEGLLKKKYQQIGSVLTNLKFKQRTPVFKYEMKYRDRLIGAWYLRIRPRDKMKNPLDGIVKVEKIAVKNEEKENGLDTEVVNNISRSILLERNVTCFGNDTRWSNHLYPIYLTEKMLKESFLSPTYFLNKF